MISECGENDITERFRILLSPHPDSSIRINSHPSDPQAPRGPLSIPTPRRVLPRFLFPRKQADHVRRTYTSPPPPQPLSPSCAWSPTKASYNKSIKYIHSAPKIFKIILKSRKPCPTIQYLSASSPYPHFVSFWGWSGWRFAALELPFAPIAPTSIPAALPPNPPSPPALAPSSPSTLPATNFSSPSPPRAPAPSSRPTMASTGAGPAAAPATSSASKLGCCYGKSGWAHGGWGGGRWHGHPTPWTHQTTKQTVSILFLPSLVSILVPLSLFLGGLGRPCLGDSTVRDLHRRKDW